jgi:predicted GIY-YIG superfamily endonuclease
MQFDFIKRWVQEKPTNHNSNWKYYNLSGVYFLMKNNECIYIGQSINMLNRLNQHRYQKDYDYALCYLLDKNNWSYIDKVERELIKHIKPILNKSHNGR